MNAHRVSTVIRACPLTQRNTDISGIRDLFQYNGHHESGESKNDMRLKTFAQTILAAARPQVNHRSDKLSRRPLAVVRMLVIATRDYLSASQVSHRSMTSEEQVAS